MIKKAGLLNEVSNWCQFRDGTMLLMKKSEEGGCHFRSKFLFADFLYSEHTKVRMIDLTSFCEVFMFYSSASTDSRKGQKVVS